MEKDIEFNDKQGRKIVGTLRLPENANKVPGVILCHGFKGNKGQAHIKQIAEEILNKEIAVLTFDFVNTPGYSAVNFSDMTISYELEVLDKAVSFIQSVPEIDPKRIGLSGHSLGGLVVSWYCAQNPEIKSLVPLSAVYSFQRNWQNGHEQEIRDWEEKGVTKVYSGTLQKDIDLKKTFYDDGKNYDMDKMIGKIMCPTLIICGTGDRLLFQSQEYFEKLKTSQKELQTIADSDHNYTKAEWLDQVKTAAAEWFAKTL